AAPIVFRGPNGIASRVAAQHSQCFASWYAHVPGLKVVAPYTGADHKGLLKSAIRDPNPVIFLEHELVYGESFAVPDDPEFLVPIGKARIARAGEHVTITAFSRMVKLALQAAEELEKAGISAEVIDLRSLRPFDVAMVAESVKKTNRIVSVEEGWPFAGIGSEIAAIVMEECFDGLDAPLKRVAGKGVPLPYAANLARLAVRQVEGEDAKALENFTASPPPSGNGQQAAAPPASVAPKTEPPPAPRAQPAPAPAGQPAPQTNGGGRIFASPLARRMAQQAGLDLA